MTIKQYNVSLQMNSCTQPAKMALPLPHHSHFKAGIRIASSYMMPTIIVHDVTFLRQPGNIKAPERQRLYTDEYS